MSHRDIMDLLEKNGIEVHSHMSPVDDPSYQLIMDAFKSGGKTLDRYRKKEIHPEFGPWKLDKYDLHECFMSHIDEIISVDELEIETTIRKCLLESSLEDSTHTEILKSLMQLVRDLRSRHPRGISKRQSKRKYVVDTLVEEVERIIEQQGRQWWKKIEHHSVEAIVEELPNVPEDSVEAVLNRLLRLPSSDPLIHNKRIHDFLRQTHSNLARADRAMTPLSVAHLAHLLFNGEHSVARKLLQSYPGHEESTLGALVNYLRFVLDSVTIDGSKHYLGGTTYYSDLSEEDLFLGACYYNGGASRLLANQTKWDYSSVARGLRVKGVDRYLYLNDFKVGGLQPRIAELAFSQVYGRLNGTEAVKKLRDLNLETVKRLVPPWKLEPRPILPSVDWEDGYGVKYDVKSNLFYRSVSEKIGLRGFLIDRPKVKNISFQGILFTRTDADSCDWVYVGEYHAEDWPNEMQHRLLPFYFRLPDSERFNQTTENPDPQQGLKLMKDRWLRIGWQLAIGEFVASGEEKPISGESLLDMFVERCIKGSETTFLEHALWKTLTQTTLDACSKCDQDVVQSFLKLAKELLSHGYLPVNLPRIDDSPILEVWIREVLQTIGDNWSRISCDSCGRLATDKDVIRVDITRMTSNGTLEGQVKCNACNNSREHATLLTHCHRCSHYPLVIGYNPVCPGCNGLVCDWMNGNDKKRCKSCKKGCQEGQQASEDNFL